MPNFFSSQSSVVVVLCGFVECVASGFVDATRGVRETGGFFVFCKHLRDDLPKRLFLTAIGSRSADLRIDDFELHNAREVTSIR